MGKIILEKILHYKVPLMVGVAVALIICHNYLMELIIHRERSQIFNVPDELYSHPMRLALGIIMLVVIIAIIIHVDYADTTGRSLRKDRRDYHRSYLELRRYFKNADPHRMDVKSLPFLHWSEARGVILGRVGQRLVHRSTDEGGGEGKNFALFGLPGDGKTAAQIIPSALQFGGSVLAIDIKGDILGETKYYRNVKVFAPDNPSESCHYNPLYGIEDMSISERKAFLENMSMVIVNEDPNDRYFNPGGRDFFCGIALYLLSKNIRTTLPEIAQAIVHGNFIDWVNTIRESDCMEAREYTDSYYGTNEKNVGGAYGTISRYIRPFASDEMAEILTDGEDAVTPETLEKGFDIYIKVPQDKIKVYAPISTILIQNFMTYFMSRADKSTGKKIRPVLFLLDEFPQLNFDFDTISAALSTLRSKSVSVFMAQQSIAQLSSKFGEDGCREIIDTCSYISIMSAQDPQSRRFFQELIGKRKVLRTTSNMSSAGETYDKVTRSINRGAQEDEEYIFHPEDFGNLNDKVVIYANGKYVVADKTYHFK